MEGKITGVVESKENNPLLNVKLNNPSSIRILWSDNVTYTSAIQMKKYADKVQKMLL